MWSARPPFSDKFWSLPRKSQGLYQKKVEYFWWPNKTNHPDIYPHTLNQVDQDCSLLASSNVSNEIDNFSLSQDFDFFFFLSNRLTAIVMHLFIYLVLKYPVLYNLYLLIHEMSVVLNGTYARHKGVYHLKPPFFIKKLLVPRFLNWRTPRWSFSIHSERCN